MAFFNRLSLLATIIVTSTIVQVKAQNPVQRPKFEDLRKPNIFKLSPFHFFDYSLNGTFEVFDRKNYKRSLIISLTGTYRDQRNYSDKGGAIEIGGRYYPRAFRADSIVWGRNRAYGIYLGYGVQVGLNSQNRIDTYYTINGNPMTQDHKINSKWATPYFCIGYQILAFETLYIDVYAGGGMKLNEVSYTNRSVDYIYSEPNIFDRDYKGIIPKMGFTIGIGF